MRSPRGSVFGKSWTVIANMLDARVFESDDILIQFPPLIISLCGVGQSRRDRAEVMDEFSLLFSQVSGFLDR